MFPSFEKLHSKSHECFVYSFLHILHYHPNLQEIPKKQATFYVLAKKVDLLMVTMKLDTFNFETAREKQIGDIFGNTFATFSLLECFRGNLFSILTFQSDFKTVFSLIFSFLFPVPEFMNEISL